MKPVADVAGGKLRLEGKKQFINVLMTWDLVTNPTHPPRDHYGKIFCQVGSPVCVN